MDKLVVMSDLQINYQDDKTLGSVFKFLGEFQPQTLVLNGDVIDMTALSHFGMTLEQRASLDVQQQQLGAVLEKLRRTVPEARIVYVMGNHEQRLHDYIDENAAELGFLKGDELSFEKFAGLARYGIELVRPWGNGFDWHGVLITHGSIIRENTAKANLLREGTSGVSGHTHRISSFYKTNRSGSHAWVEGGCLCSIRGAKPPPNTPGVVDWQQGFVVGYWDSGIWNLYPISITSHCFIFNGQLYRP